MAKYSSLMLALFIVAALTDFSSANAGDDPSAPCQGLKGLLVDIWSPLLKQCGVKELHFTCSGKGAAGVSLVPSEGLKKYTSPEDLKIVFCDTFTTLSRIFMNSEQKDVSCSVSKNGVISLGAVPGKAVNGELPKTPCDLFKEIQGAWEKCLKALGFDKFKTTCQHGGNKAIMEIGFDPSRGLKPAELKELWRQVFDKICKLILSGKNIEVTVVEKANAVFVIADTVGTITYNA